MKPPSSINGQTRFVAVLGHPIAHTASPAMHNAAFDALGMNWRYLALDVDPARLGPALRGLALCGFVGVNCTIPHKRIAFREADCLDSSARIAEAANTLSSDLSAGERLSSMATAPTATASSRRFAKSSGSTPRDAPSRSSAAAAPDRARRSSSRSPARNASSSSTARARKRLPSRAVSARFVRASSAFSIPPRATCSSRAPASASGRTTAAPWTPRSSRSWIPVAFSR